MNTTRREFSVTVVVDGRARIYECLAVSEQEARAKAVAYYTKHFENVQA